MHILLVAATTREIQATIDFCREQKSRIDGLTISIAITGIGLVSTTYRLIRCIVDRQPDLVIQAGIAGSYFSEKICSVVAVSEDALADMGVREENVFKTIFDLGIEEKNLKPFTNGRLINPHQELLSASGLELAKAISVNEVTTDKTRIAWYQHNFSPVIESMEGAAFHYVCLQEKIPFLQIRAVSNDVGERDKSKWQVRESIDQLNKQLTIFLNKLTIYDATHFGV